MRVVTISSEVTATRASMHECRPFPPGYRPASAGTAGATSDQAWMTKWFCLERAPARRWRDSMRCLRLRWGCRAMRLRQVACICRRDRDHDASRQKGAVMTALSTTGQKIPDRQSLQRTAIKRFSRILPTRMAQLKTLERSSLQLVTCASHYRKHEENGEVNVRHDFHLSDNNASCAAQENATRCIGRAK